MWEQPPRLPALSEAEGSSKRSDGKIVAAGNTSVDQGFGAGAYVARYLAQ
jgi:hypothetical protein